MNDRSIRKFCRMESPCCSRASPVRHIKIVVQSLKSGERKELFAGDAARYLPTGHIVYALGNNLFAVPFDLNTLEVTGGPVPVVEGVLRAGGAPQYAVSDSGTLVYMPGTASAAATASDALSYG